MGTIYRGVNIFLYNGTTPLPITSFANTSNTDTFYEISNGNVARRYQVDGLNDPEFTSLTPGATYWYEAKLTFEIPGAVPPLPGTVVPTPAPTPTPTPTPATATWTKVADEWGSFTLTGTQRVRFGTGADWIEATLSGTNDCYADTFGGDPATGRAKTCEVLSSSSEPTPTPSPTPTPTPTPTPAPSPSSYFTQAGLGMGLNGISDWSPQMPFLNILKHGRPFEGGTLDEDGYPISGTASTVVFADNPMSAGQWVVKWDGQGTFAWSGATVVSSAVNRQVITTTAGTVVSVTVTSTSSTDYPKNIRIVLESQESLLDSGKIFSPVFVAKLRESKSRVLRFMDWISTNWSTQSAWGDRPKLTTAVWSGWGGKGVPIEAMCALANELDMHPWFCIPHLATDEYIRQFAIIVNANLNLALMPHVEYSNEVWNWGFGQSVWCLNAGKARWGDDVDDAHVQWVGMKCAQITRIWKEIIGASRVKGVLATQTVWLGLEEGLLNSPKWVAEGNTAPKTICDLYAVTPYFDCGLVNNETYSTVLSWAGQGAAGTDKAFQQMLSNNQFPAQGGVDKYLPEFRYHKGVCDRNSLSLVAYEGGQHILNFTSNDSEVMTDFLISLSRDPRMEQVYDKNFANWKNSGGTIFCHFVDISTPTKWGCWGALERVDQATSPKWKSLVAWATVNQGV